MNERRADIVWATVIALAFAAIVVKGAGALRSFDSWGRQLEERLLPDAASINQGEPQGADAYALFYSSSGGVADFSATNLRAVVYLCLAGVFIKPWVISIHRRNLKGNPPRAPAFAV